MASFRYEAMNEGGGSTQGTIRAEDRRSALRQLESGGLFPLTLESCPTGTSADDRRATTRVTGRIRRKEITAFSREMATLLAASITIPAALEGLGEQEENEALGDLIRELGSAVRQGVPLSDAMKSFPEQFSTLYTSMVRVGEESGNLDTVLADLAALMESEDEIRGEVLGAVAYPCFVLIMGVVTTFVLLAFVLPRIFEMIQGMTAALPLPTRILLAVSDFFQDQWPWILGTVVAGLFALRAYLKSTAGKLRWDSLKLGLPLLGPVYRASALGRFSRTLGTLTRSGVSLLPALEIVRDTVGNRMVSECIDTVTEETRGGDSLAAPLRKLGIFPPTMIQMIAVGEETGTLDDMLMRVSTIQERLLRDRSRTLISLLAPVLILVVGGFVGFIVIALLLPIFQMSQLIG